MEAPERAEASEKAAMGMFLSKSEAASGHLALAKESVKASREALEQHPLHRYINDLESALYCMCYVASIGLEPQHKA